MRQLWLLSFELGHPIVQVEELFQVVELTHQNILA
jgi:hypothetical protein